MKFSDNVVYCDNHILVVNKPAGMSTQEHRKGEENLEALAKEWVKNRYSKPGAVFLHPVHRLDKVVSGLVLFARTSKALSRLQKMMREKKIEKRYVALVEGIPKEKEKNLFNFIEHGHLRAKIGEKGKEAELHYRTFKTLRDKALLEVTLITGRYHQIRAQLAFMGHPIIGDEKYGSRVPFKKGGIALCHTEMSLMHPVTEEFLTFHLPKQDILKMNDLV